MPARLVAVLVAALSVAAPVALGGAARGADGPAPRVTLIADSVGGAFTWMGDARATLARGLDLDLEVAACRKLVDVGCPYRGERPPSALETIRARKARLGDVVVVMVGYNDVASAFESGIDPVLRALAARGVEHVVWVTLRETRPAYAEMNQAVVGATARWPGLVVADWSAASAGHEDWFSDEVHLTVAGGDALARLLRPVVLGACGAPCARGGRLLAVVTSRLPGAQVGRPYSGRLVAGGGTPPYRWTVVGLPRPLHVSATGAVSGRPRASGRFTLHVAVVDAAGIRNEGVVGLAIAPRG